MSLIRAELRRFGKRRITRLMLGLVVALLATVAITIAVEHQKPGPAAVAAAEAAADREFRQQQRLIEEEVAACEADPDRFGLADCEEIRQFWPTREQLVESNLPPAFEFRTGFRDMITVFVGVLALFAFLVGASFVGAEWRTGGMMNLLLWRPRRLQVLGGKLLALLAALLGLGVLGGAAWTGGLWLVASFRGITDTMTAGTWQSFGLDGVRGLALVLVAGAVGFALASLGRHSAMAMGTAIAGFVVGVAGVAIVANGLLQLPFWERWLWTTYVNAWLEGGAVVFNFRAPCQGIGPCETPEYVVTWQMAGAGIAAAVVLLLGAAMWQMRRRDVA